MDGDLDSFNRNLEVSYGNSMGLSVGQKSGLRTMQQTAYHEWLFEQMQPLMENGKFEEAKSVLEQQKSLPYISKGLNKVLDNIDDIVYSSKRLYEAELAIRDFRLDEAITILDDIVGDEKMPLAGKSTARRMLSSIKELERKFKHENHFP
jgi:hypothetical protein